MAFKNLETVRLILKNISDEDTLFMYKEFSTDIVNKYLYDAEAVSSVEEAKEWVDFYTKDDSLSRHRYIIMLKTNNEKIGTCGFHRFDIEKKSVEIGYDLQPEYWNNGYMSEAVDEMILYLKNDLDVKIITACIAKDNFASIKLVTKKGFYKTNNDYFEEFHGKKYLHYVYQLDL